MKKILVFGALFLIVPILLSGCGSNTPASPISDYDKVSLIEYQECLALLGASEIDKISAFRLKFGFGEVGVSTFKSSVLEACKEYRPVKEEVPLSVK